MQQNIITRREFGERLLRDVGGAALAGALTSSLGALAPGQSSARPPNLVLVVSDQHAYKYCGFMGHPIVRTPNLDRIAREGSVFTSAYCGSPVCTPSRAGMISGVYPSDCNSFCNASPWDGSLPTWPRLLREAGYHTFGTGKLDANNGFDLGFDQTLKLTNEHADSPDVTAFFRRPLCFRPGERKQIDGGARGKRHADQTLADGVAAHIRGRAGRDGPWAAYCGFHLPHPSFVGLAAYFEDYLARVDLPEVTAESLERQHPVFEQLRNFKDIATPIPTERVRRARAAYYAMITEVDEYIGRIWDAIRDTGQLANTVFVYTSDHGEALGDHGLWLKNNLYDVAARVPLVMAGADIPRKARVDAPVAHVDLIRTLLEYGGARLHPRLRGHSLAPLMRGRPGGHPGWAYSESHSEGNCTGSFVIRKGPWKYIHFTWYDGLLFNLAEDPGELRDRFGDSAAQSVLTELQGILRSQVDPVEVTERAFRIQRRNYDAMAARLTPDQMLDQLRSRLGEGQAVALLAARYGHPFPYRHKPPVPDAQGT